MNPQKRVAINFGDIAIHAKKDHFIHVRKHTFRHSAWSVCVWLQGTGAGGKEGGGYGGKREERGGKGEGGVRGVRGGRGG